tara:strand:+ start:2344 stop:2451 length:108 start_codon:yes stop_codon:yes gene_type:complete
LEVRELDRWWRWIDKTMGVYPEELNQKIMDKISGR